MRSLPHAPRSRDHDKVKSAASDQKRREGETPNGATLKAAERRASLRAAKNPVKLARVQETMGSADVAVRSRRRVHAGEQRD